MSSKYHFLLICMLMGRIFSISLSLTEIPINAEVELHTTLNPHGSLNSVQISRNTLQNLSTQYVEHEPIKIDGNADFAVTATLENWPGNGTLSNPYIISGYAIRYLTTNLIDLQNTDVYFQISNNALDGKKGRYNGINLYNVTHGSIVNNNIQHNARGIELWSVKNSSLFGNMVFFSWVGIYLRDSADITLTSNLIIMNTGRGIEIRGSGICTLTNNTISHNDGYAISLDSSSDDITVKLNNFIGNNRWGSSQASDNGQNNEFVYNYWDDWTSPDTNADGVIDSSYPIDGSVENRDIYPLALRLYDISRSNTISLSSNAIAGSNMIILSSNAIAGLILLAIILSVLVVSMHKQKRT